MWNGSCWSAAQRGALVSVGHRGGTRAGCSSPPMPLWWPRNEARAFPGVPLGGTARSGRWRIELFIRPRRRGRGDRTIHSVITVPNLLSPRFSVPVQFSAGAGTVIVVPAPFIGRPIRVTSLQATAVPSSAGVGTFAIGLASGPASTTGVITRTVPVSGAPVEVRLRNNKYVQPVLAVAGTELAVITLTNCTITGVIMMTVMSAF